MKNVIFLVGGPGSGKDVILKNVLSQYTHKELKLEQIIESILDIPFIVVSTNAYRFEDIQTKKELFERYNYKTAMIFVDVDNVISKTRLQERNIPNNIREEKLKISKDNIQKFNNIFNDFIVYENNNILENANQLKSVSNFCDIFLYKDIFFLSESKHKTKKHSLKSKLEKIVAKLNTEPLMSAPTDRIGDDCSTKGFFGAGISSVGPTYESDYYADTLPMFADPSRNIPEPEYVNKDPISKIVANDRPLTRSIYRKRIKKIKKIAKNSWKNRKYV